MRLDLCLPNNGPFAAEAIRAAPVVEAMGYDGIWLIDHVLGLPEAKIYDENWLELLTSLAFIAASTTTVRLGTGVLVLPYRDPALAAKMITTIDVLSDGRLDLGVGTGWSEREFRALGRGDVFAERGLASDRALETFLKCWQGGEVNHSDGHSCIEGVIFAPVPVQRPRPPIWIGALATARAPLARAAKYADVWHPAAITPEDLKAAGERLDAAAGRLIPRSIRLVVRSANEAIDILPRYRDAGCFQATVEFAGMRSVGELLVAAEQVLASRPTQ